MAQMKITLFSPSLARFTEFELYYPCDTPPMMVGDNPHYKRPTKTLFLLHGYSGMYSDWGTNAPIAQLAMQYNLAVVCPSGENSFYLNQKGTGRKYEDFIAQDLVTFLRNAFGLAKTPEETSVGGLSMGGFGALHLGLARPDVFGRIIALSSALIHNEVANMKPGSGNPTADYDYYAATFGDPAELPASPNNPEFLVKELKAAGTAIPGVYMACGTEDFLLGPNRAFHQFLVDQGVAVEYHESPGVHNFAFWSQYIEPAIQWALA